jgi:hypothetical protein
MILSTHSGRLERWLGADSVEQISKSMRGWYGPPIAVGGVPGSVWACGDGDFRGRISAGQLAPAIDFVEQRLRRILRNAARRQLSSVNTGFSSLSDLISEATAGKSRYFPFTKNNTSAPNVLSGSISLWHLGIVPPAGADAAAAPAGEAPDDAMTGAFVFTNPGSGDTQHFVKGEVACTVAPSTLLLYDRIYQVKKTMNSNATESVTGVPTRYQSSTPGDANYAAGNFVFPEIGTTVLAAGAHNWTVCQYRNQAGTDSQAIPSIAGNTTCPVHRVDLAPPLWFMPLATGDTGAMDLAQMQYDTSAIATGILNFVIGHPIALLPVPIVNFLCVTDGIMTAFNLVRIFDDAALAFMDIFSSTTTTKTYAGSLTTVAG